MRYHALACDYDGTLASHGALADQTADALRRVRASGRKVLLVTGRRLDDLERVCPELTLFDAIVADNGAVLHRPSARETRALAASPPPAFVQALRARGVDPLAVGQVIVATEQPHETTVLETIRSLGLELQVIFNKGAVMILPSGVNKATGLEAALDALGLSAHNVVGVGDGENDHAFLSRCACAVAVAGAIPALKDAADWVTSGDAGAGVVELIERLLAEDLASVAPALVRHDIPLGQDDRGREHAIPAYGAGVLLAGTSGGGKSTIVTGFVERLTERRYQYCIVDPEGDYSTLEGPVVLGDAHRAPTVEEAVDVLSSTDRNLVLNLMGLTIDQRPVFFAALLPQLLGLRTRFGRPHWIVIDETHHLLPDSWEAVAPAVPDELHGLVMVTVHPEHVSPIVLRTVNLVLAIGRNPAHTLGELARARAVAAPSGDWSDLEPGQVIAWRVGSAESPAQVRTIPPRTERKRHARKYAEGELGPDKSFYFRGPEGRLNLRAQNLRLFLQGAEGVDEGTWLHHLRLGDYSRWIREAIKDEALADEIAAIEAAAPPRDAAGPATAAAESRAQVRAAIEARYTAPA
jgi:HAD superfamily hydrolase (TIGR01484 family)